MPDKNKAPQPVSRLGELLIQRRLLSPQALDHALAVQRAAMDENRRVPKLGEILVKGKVLDKRTIREILDVQKLERGEKRLLKAGLEEPEPRIVVVTLQGRLDNQTSAVFVRILERLMNRGVCRIAVDCEKLVYVNSFGISAFIRYVDECRTRAGDMNFFNLCSSVKATILQIGLGPFIHIKDSKRDAVAALRKVEAPRSVEPAGELVSTSSGRFFHLSYCPDARKFEEETRLYFIDRSKAEKSGKLACPKCNP